MKESEIEMWKEVRKAGRLRYVMVSGILSYGVAMTIAMAFVNKPYVDGLFTGKMLGHVVLWLSSGVLFGLSMWFINERRFKKSVRAASDSE